MKYDFTIFGSGISAKIISSLLARNGFKVCLISDRDQNQKINTNLVTFLSAGSLNYLLSVFSDMQFLNKYPEIKSINCHLNSLGTDKVQSINFNEPNNTVLGRIVRNSDLEDYLDEQINNINNLNIINERQLSAINNTNAGVKLKLDNGKDIESELFILSSSKKSIVSQINIDFLERDLEQEALSINIKGDIKNKNHAFQKFTKDGPLALLPYSKNEASIVWSLKSNSKILLKNNEELTKTITKHFNDYVTSINVVNIEKHKLKFLYAKNIFHKNCVLIGNIAHNIHPIAGQGLNLSIKDIALFIKLMMKYKSIGYKLSNKLVLEEFEMKRKLDNAAYSFGTFSLNNIFSSNSNFLNFTTRKGLNVLEKSKLLKQLFINSATGKDFFKSL